MRYSDASEPDSGGPTPRESRPASLTGDLSRSEVDGVPSPAPDLFDFDIRVAVVYFHRLFNHEQRRARRITTADGAAVAYDQAACTLVMAAWTDQQRERAARRWWHVPMAYAALLADRLDRGFASRP
jgi:hypothetical protein